MALYEKQNTMKVVCLLSGGIDSTTMLFRLMRNEHDIFPLFVNYGQKAAKKELEAAIKACELLSLQLNIIDISGLSSISSSLTDKDAPLENSFFPNRNMILLSVAAAFSANQSCNVISIGTVGGTGFADQTRKFVVDAELALSHGRRITVLAPLTELNKLEVVRLAKENCIPLDFTYSCYMGDDLPCGKCLACIERKNVLEIESIT